MQKNILYFPKDWRIKATCGEGNTHSLALLWKEGKSRKGEDLPPGGSKTVTSWLTRKERQAVAAKEETPKYSKFTAKGKKKKIENTKRRENW